MKETSKVPSKSKRAKVKVDVEAASFSASIDGDADDDGELVLEVAFCANTAEKIHSEMTRRKATRGRISSIPIQRELRQSNINAPERANAPHLESLHALVTKCHLRFVMGPFWSGSAQDCRSVG